MKDVNFTCEVCGWYKLGGPYGFVTTGVSAHAWKCKQVQGLYVQALERATSDSECQRLHAAFQNWCRQRAARLQPKTPRLFKRGISGAS